MIKATPHKDCALDAQPLCGVALILNKLSIY